MACCTFKYAPKTILHSCRCSDSIPFSQVKNTLYSRRVSRIHQRLAPDVSLSFVASRSSRWMPSFAMAPRSDSCTFFSTAPIMYGSRRVRSRSISSRHPMGEQLRTCLPPIGSRHHRRERQPSVRYFLRKTGLISSHLI